MRSEFGELLRARRRQSGKTMLDVAQHLEVSVVFISDVERGNRSPLTPARIMKAAHFLGADPEPFLLAAAKSRGSFELDATHVSGKARQVGAALMRGWAKLDKSDLEKIARIVRRRGESKDA
jgi:transcriptional regulator with XRE-family HTH domain